MTEIKSDSLPLYQKNPLTRFSSRATEYAQYRPTYPPEVIAQILEGWSNISTIVAADLGAGTGISSRLLADRGVRVLAVEPNEAMRQEATPHPRIEWRNGTAEATKLANQSVDLVTAFQAFHWFNPSPTLEEFCRILKPDGRVAIVWNHRNRKDEFTQEFSQVLKQASKSRSWEYEKRHTLTTLQESCRFQNIRHFVSFHQQPLDLTGLIGRTQSSSYIPTEGTEAEEVIAQLEKLYQKWKDEQQLVYIGYRTDVYLAEVKQQ
ncbi:class I SAM-dependent methyltransferase [Capilliphycus salinus ALCB114379]|uniref:class I SAM-dependent methyltransferase n=1 Tax=Capilliphycus salinus TaxID=2768948 RepID=UPI0039A662A7